MERCQQLKCLTIVLAVLCLSCDEPKPRIAYYDSSGFPIYDEADVLSFVRPNEVGGLALEYMAWDLFPHVGIAWQSPENGRVYDSLASWANAHFDYISDGDVNSWNTPSMTIAAGGGDCEDLAVLVASIFLSLRDQTLAPDFPDFYLVCGYHPSGEMHAWLEVHWTVPEMPGEGYIIDTSGGGASALYVIGENPIAGLYAAHQHILINVGE